MSTRIGFVGAGFIATRHADILRTFDDVRVVAVADPLFDRAGALAGSFAATPYASHTDMLESEDLDGVYICVPPFAHGPPETAALEAGVPFFVEKPLAIDLPTAEAISAGVAARELPVAVGYHWRYLDTFERARELLADNPARLALGYWLDATPPPPWWLRQAHSGGQTIEQTTHILDLVRCLVGEATEVYAVGARTERPAFPDGDVCDVTAASLRFATGAVGSVSSTCLLGWRHRVGLHLFAEGMAIELSEFEMIVDVGTGRPVEQAHGDAVARQDRHFVDVLQGKTVELRAPYHDALRTHRLACTVARSAEERRPLTLDGHD